jgi:hypothetical protein
MSVKLSVSMSSALYQRLERVRQGRGIARSLAVQEALEGWVAGGGNSLDADYLAAYQREPESPAEMDAWAAASAEAWSAGSVSTAKKTTQRGRTRAKG